MTAVRAFAIARVGLRYSERYVVHLAALRVLTEIRVWLFRAIEPLAPGGLGGFRSGDLLARTVADVDTLDAFFVRGLVPPVAAVLAVAFGCVVLAAFDPALALVLLAFLAIGGLAVPLATRRRARRPSERSIAARAELHAGLTSDLSGLADLTAFGHEGRLGEDLTRWSRAIEGERRTLASIRGAGAGAGAIVAGSAGLAVLALAIPGVRNGGIEGVFLASLPLVAFAAYEAVQPLGDAFREIELSRAAAVRTFEIVDAPAPVPEPSDPLTPPAHPSIELRHVRFRYDVRSPEVVDDLSLTLAPGEHLGLTGPSGAGKTTIVGLLLRFWDASSGEVLLGGVDVRSFRTDDVRALIGVVPQQVYLFNGTIRDNLLVADGDADDARILDVVRARRARRVPRFAAAGARHARRGRRDEVERRGTPTRRDRPSVPQGRADPDPGRGDGQPRRRDRGRGRRPTPRVRAGQDARGDLAPPGRPRARRPGDDPGYREPEARANARVLR